MATIKMNLAGLNAQALTNKAHSIVTEMTNNAHFPSPTPSISTIDSKLKDFKYWIFKTQCGEKVALLKRNQIHVELEDMLRQLAAYVSSVAKGDSTLILSSGFSLRQSAVKSPKIAMPVNLEISRTPFEGRVKLKWDRVKHSKMYLVELTTDSPDSGNAIWKAVVMTTKSRTEICDLVFGTYYYFHVKAIGAKTESPFSDVALIRAA